MFVLSGQSSAAGARADYGPARPAHLSASGFRQVGEGVRMGGGLSRLQGGVGRALTWSGDWGQSRQEVLSHVVARTCLYPSQQLTERQSRLIAQAMERHGQRAFRVVALQCVMVCATNATALELAPLLLPLSG